MDERSQPSQETSIARRLGTALQTFADENELTLNVLSDTDPKVVIHWAFEPARAVELDLAPILLRLQELCRRQQLAGAQGPLLSASQGRLHVTIETGHSRAMGHAVVVVAEALLVALLADVEDIACRLEPRDLMTPRRFWLQLAPQLFRTGSRALERFGESLSTIGAESRLLRQEGRNLQGLQHLPPHERALRVVINGFFNALALGLYVHHLQCFLARHRWRIDIDALYGDVAVVLRTELFGLRKEARRSQDDEVEIVTRFDPHGAFLSREGWLRLRREKAQEQPEGVARSMCPGLTMRTWQQCFLLADRAATLVRGSHADVFAQLDERARGGAKENGWAEACLVTGHLIDPVGHTLATPNDTFLVPFSEHLYLVPLDE